MPLPGLGQRHMLSAPVGCAPCVDSAYLGIQVGNGNFAFSLQQLVNLPLLWSLEAHLNVTNATTQYPQAVPVRLLPTPVR